MSDIIEFSNLSNSMARAMLENVEIHNWYRWQILSVGEQITWRCICGVPSMILYARYPEKLLRVVQLVPEIYQPDKPPLHQHLLGRFNAALAQGWYHDKTERHVPVDLWLSYFDGSNHQFPVIRETSLIIDELVSFARASGEAYVDTEAYSYRFCEEPDRWLQMAGDDDV